MNNIIGTSTPAPIQNKNYNSISFLSLIHRQPFQSHKITPKTKRPEADSIRTSAKRYEN